MRSVLRQVTWPYMVNTCPDPYSAHSAAQALTVPCSRLWYKSGYVYTGCESLL